MQKLGTSPESVARAIVRGIRQNTAVERVGLDSWAVATLARLSPTLVPRLIARASRSKLFGGML